MDNYKLVHPGHLNHHGFLFGGNMLKWVDEYAYIAVCADFPQQLFVTVAMDQLQFRKSVGAGEILRFRCRLVERRTSSVRYAVEVSRKTEAGEREEIFATHVAYVCVNERGEKKALPQGRGAEAV
ncbi:hotdog domain-containing protein [Pelagicoccus sp. SDUM812005]|uniref:acyl-CoA thioesterase n=1 Tax=Pelagicoccus sp. SDUM812005 TaxID=3041257 RepID=UPI00280D5551|nr:hotdog domain-containing protein [Pelagicoccus sp. SDUM812005]MDQ8179177.1 hotdog domain-containing protein [Pelagicoccus sp. SDUM812005]